MSEEKTPVSVTFTVSEARAMLCNRADCTEHPPEAKSDAWRKLARATQQVTASNQPDQAREESER